MAWTNLHAWPLQEALKACLTFTRSLNHKKKRKEKKWTQNEFLVFPFSIFSLSFLSLFNVNILLSLHKRRGGGRFVYVCFPKTRNLSSLLTTLQEAILLKFSNIFVKAKLHTGQLYFQLLWDAYSGTCDALSLLFSQGVPCSSVKTVHVHIDMAEQLAVNNRWRHVFGWSVQLTVDNETSKSWSALILYRLRKIKSPTVRQCTFLQRNLDLAGTSSPMVRWQPRRRPRTRCSRARRT